jgi:GDP-L-fucose synthase
MQKINFEDLKGNTKEIKNTHINIGTGKDLTIKELADMVKEIVGFEGIIEWDKTKPDGTRQKLLNVDKINRLGWKEKTNFYDGLKLVYSNYLDFK